VIDRLTLAFFFRAPSDFSPKMTQNNINFYRWCPIFSLGITFWIYTNEQMFNNKIEPINSPQAVRKSFHLITNLNFGELQYFQKKILMVLAAYIGLFVLVEMYLRYEKRQRKNEVSF